MLKVNIILVLISILNFLYTLNEIQTIILLFKFYLFHFFKRPYISMKKIETLPPIVDGEVLSKGT